MLTRVCHVGALIIRIGLGVYYTIVIRRNSPKPYSTFYPILGCVWLYARVQHKPEIQKPQTCRSLDLVSGLSES